MRVTRAPEGLPGGLAKAGLSHRSPEFHRTLLPSGFSCFSELPLTLNLLTSVETHASLKQGGTKTGRKVD